MRNPPRQGPPRAFRWLLEHALPADVRDDISGDLMEVYRRDAETRGLTRARWCYRRKVASFLWRFALDGLRASPRSGATAGLVGDVLTGARLLRRSRGFTALAVLTLSLGAGVSAAVLGVGHAVLRASSWWDEPDSLVAIRLRTPTTTMPFTPAEFVDLRDSGGSLEALAAYRVQNQAVVRDATGGEPRLLQSAGVSAEFLPLIGLEPQVGRAFQAEDTRPGAARVVLLSERAARAIAGDIARAPGLRLTIDDGRYTSGVHTVVGVLPPMMDLLDATVDLWVPIPLDASVESYRSRSENVQLLGRLRGSAPLADVGHTVTAEYRRLRGMAPDASAPAITVTRLADERLEPFRFPLTVLLAVVAAVLGVATINLSSLFLGRLDGRSAELATRRALGASGWQIARVIWIEAAVVGLGAAAGAFGVAWWSSGVLTAALPGALDRTGGRPGVETVLGGAIVLALGVAFAACAPPTVHYVRRMWRMPQRASGSRAPAATHRLRRVLVVAQIGLVVPLVVAAGLLVTSMNNLLAQQTGIDPERVLALQVDVRRADMRELNVVFGDILDAVRSVPGVEAASIVRGLPFSGGASVTSVRVAERADEATVLVDYQVVHPGFFETLRIPLISGRDFVTADRDGAEGVAIVNRAYVEAYVPAGREPLGSRVHSGPGWTIVGIVGDVRRRGFREPARPEMYVPYAQVFNARGTRQLLVRTTGQASADLTAIRAAVESVEPAAAVSRVRSMDEVLSTSLDLERGLANAMTAAAALTLPLAGIGLYGVVAYGVRRRFREFGIRAALGARPADLRRLAAREGLGLVLVGVPAGLLLALGAGRVLAGFLFQVTVADPRVLAGAAGALTLLTAAALLGPMRRATRADPLQLLRND